MEPERNQRIEALFHEARKLPPDMRPAFLKGACEGDAGLEAEVTDLLKEYDRIDGTPNNLAEALLTLPGEGEELQAEGDAPAPDLPYERLGEFHLIRELGGGGMGLVYLAVQESLDRQVALKVIHPAKEVTPEISTRFWREINALSKLSHPNIVKIYDSGEDRGIRYFAMELVSGKSLDRILMESEARGGSIPANKILNWMIQVAEALECAHDAKIIHRDVNPKNIQITPQGRAVLMDFGLARHMNLSTLTVAGQVRATLEYASPEQISMRQKRIDDRTDIYSLGVTLYKAFAGRVPFKGDTTQQVLHQILEAEPVTPRRLNPSISRDLETVILRAMEKDLRHRYQKISHLAGDLKKVLHGDPDLVAKPPSLGTKVWKRVKRNPLMSAALGLALLLLGVLVGFMLWSYSAITNERNIARQEADKALAALTYLNRFILDTTPSSGNPVEQGTMRVKDLLDSWKGKLDADSHRYPEIEAPLRNLIGWSYRSHGLYSEAEEQFRASLELFKAKYGESHPQTLNALERLATTLAEQRVFESAEELMRQVVDGFLRIHGEDDPLTMRAVKDLAYILNERNEHREAETLYRKALDWFVLHRGEEDIDTLNAMNGMAHVLRNLQKYGEAKALWEKALDLALKTLGEDHYLTPGIMSGLSSVIFMEGAHDRALEMIRKARKIQGKMLGETHPNTIRTMLDMNFMLLQLGRFDEAETQAQDAHSICRQEYGEEDPVTLSWIYRLGILLRHTGRIKESIARLQGVLEAQTRVLGETHPDTLATMNDLARVLMEDGELERAKETYCRVYEASKNRFGSEDPNTLRYLHNLSIARMEMGEYSEAEENLQEVLRILRVLYGERNQETIQTTVLYANLLMMQGRFEEAERELCRSVELASTGLPEGNLLRGIACMHFGDCLTHLKKYDQAEEQLLKSYERFRMHPGSGELARMASGYLATLYDAWGKPVEADQYRNRTIK